MTSPTEQLAIQLVVQGQQQASAALGQASSSLGRFQSAAAKANKAATGIIAGVAAIAYQAGDAASEVQQAMGGIESVFGSAAGTVEQWARSAASSVGLATDEYANAAAKFGAQFKNMGLSQDEMLKGTEQMIGLGADLAATFGGSTQEAVDALSAAFRGEADSAERYGLNLSAASVQAELARKGQAKLTGTALAQARAQAIMSLATKQAGGSIGQFAREADTASGAEQRRAAATRNTSAALGAVLLPIMQKGSEYAARFAQVLSDNAGTTKIVAAAVLGAAVAVKVLNAAINASPLARIVTVLAAIAGGLVLLYQRSETFRAVVNTVWSSVRDAALAAWRIIGAIIGQVVAVARDLWQRFGSTLTLLWGGIKAAVQAAWNIIGGIIRAVAALVTGNWKAFGDALGQLWAGIKAAAAAAWQLIGAAITAVVEVVRLAWDGLVGLLGAIWSGIKAAAGTAWEAIGGVITAVVTVVTDAWNAVVEFFAGLWRGISSTAGTIWDGIGEAITSVIETIRDAWNGLLSFFSGLFQSIKDIVQGAWDWIMDKVRGIKNAILDSANLIGNSNIGIQMPGQGSGPGGGGSSLVPMPVRYRGGNVTFNITGSADPGATARRVMELLRAEDRRQHGIVLGGTP